MDTILILLGGIALGTYYSEDVRKVVPILDPNKSIGDSNATN